MVRGSMYEELDGVITDVYFSFAGCLTGLGQAYNFRFYKQILIFASVLENRDGTYDENTWGDCFVDRFNVAGLRWIGVF